MAKVTVTILMILMCYKSLFAQNKDVGCSIWRRDVKILMDLSADDLNKLFALPSQSKSVQDLNNEVFRYKGVVTQLTTNAKWENVPRQPSESYLVNVKVKIKACGKEGNDHDYHIVLQDINNPAVTMVAEIPDPDCDEFKNLPALQARYKTLRDWFDANISTPTTGVKDLQQPYEITVVGVPFWDAKHPGTVDGAAMNFREIHPVLNFIPNNGKAVIQ